MSPRRFGLLTVALGTLILAGCHSYSGEDEVPEAAKALGCPDLTGTYAIPEASVELDPREWLGYHAKGKTWQSFSLQAIVPGAPVYVSLRRTDSEIANEVAALKASRPKAYNAWLDKASLSYVERGVTRRAHYDALGELGPTPEIGFSTPSGICIDSWFEYPGDHASNEDYTALALDADKHLLIKATRTTRDEFPIWCGDGCKGIPYAWHTKVSWVRAKRIENAKPWVFKAPAEPEAPAVDAYDDRDPRVAAFRQRVFAALPEGATMFNFHLRSDGVIFSGTAKTHDDLEAIKRLLSQDSIVVAVHQRRAWVTNRGDIEFALEIPLEAP
ncbi:hypothetical protein C7S18_02335 [Ahniella affigens]|uniref:Lipoprotein n=1 Tax=Ahniella affigens TaxID=2021234 RepID=A0A2P1PMN7_9GAMM|nr:hypothetical protein [Ahniella affigens]AVP96102.1 hypothetical protein C7S18_02335 [Ahniella affigens]